jgi:hypothetical protein
MDNNYANIPTELKRLDQWVCWKYHTNEKGQRTKIPITPDTNKYASPTDPTTWRSYVAAVANKKQDGIGFVFTADDEFCGIDLDHSVHKGYALPWAFTIIREMQSYTEISPSGTGLHIIVQGKLPKGKRVAKGDGVEIECYDTARYLCFTGHVVGEFKTINARQAELISFHQRYLAPVSVPTAAPVAASVAAPGPAPKQSPAAPTDKRKIKYAAAALAGECAKVRAAPTGDRNNTLSNAARALGELVASELLTESDVITALTTAASDAGLGKSETEKTIRSGLNKRKAEPRNLKHLEDGNGNGNSHTPPEEPPIRPKRYTIIAGAFHSIERLRDGDVFHRALCDFTGHIAEETNYDNGLDRVTRLTIHGKTHDGREFPVAEISAAEFASMGWVLNNWGVSAVIYAGNSIKDKLREAIQHHSREQGCISKQQYGHTGFRVINGQRVYLTNSGAIGLDNVCVQLEGKLKEYSLPTSVEKAARKPAAKASLGMLTIGAPQICYPLWGAMYLAPLSEIIEPNFTIWCYGETGSGKTSTCAEFLRHFGERWDFKNMPENWISTKATILKHCFICKDVPLIVDNYVPAGTGMDAAKQETLIRDVLQAIGDHSARNRLNQDTTDKPGYPPRGLLIATGEQEPPGGYSTTARIISLEFRNDSEHHPQSVDLVKLGKYQQATALNRQNNMTGYITWLIENYDTLRAELPKRIRDERTNFAVKGIHPRTPDAFASLYVATALALDYCQSVGGLTEKEKQAHLETTRAVYLELAQRQTTAVNDDNPARRFIRVVEALLLQGRIYVLSTQENRPAEGIDRKGDFVGWEDEQFYHLLVEPTYNAVCRFATGESRPFTISSRALYRALATQEMLVISKDREHPYTPLFKGARTIRLVKAKLIENL